MTLRTILSVLSGLLIGAAGVLYFGPDDSSRTAGSPGGEAGSRNAIFPSGPAEPEAVVRRIAAGEELQRSTVYEVALLADERDLLAQIEAIANGRATATQRLALGILFARYAELDPTDSINALALIRDPQLAQTTALEILEVIGFDDFNIGWVAAALPGSDPLTFRVEAIARLSESSPSAALQLTLLTDSRAHRSFAIRRVARAWAQTDPAAAFAAADLLQDDTLKNTMRRVAGQEWARTRPETLMSHLAGLTTRAEFIELGRTGAVVELADAFPERLLELADNLPDAFANDVRASALFNWSETDPLAAFAYSQTMPAGEQRQRTQQQIARIFGQSDPDAALLWLNSVTDPSGELTSSVLQGVAETDPDRALELAFDQETDLRQPWAIQLIMMRIGSSEPERMPQIADTVLAIDDESQRDQALNMLTQGWSRTDVEGALEWSLSKAGDLPAGVLSQIARLFVGQDPAAAMAYVDRVPPEARDTWIESIAGGYARYDRQSAIDWVGQYRGQDAYVPAMMSIVRTTIQEDPAEAARLLDSLGTPPETDPYTIAQIVSQWAEQDAATARRYSLDLPRGELRDAALRSLVNRNSSLRDAELLAAFSTDLARERALVRIIRNVARDDPAQARRLIDDHITYPAIRQEAEESVDRISR